MSSLPNNPLRPTGGLTPWRARRQPQEITARVRYSRRPDLHAVAELESVSRTLGS